MIAVIADGLAEWVTGGGFISDSEEQALQVSRPIPAVAVLPAASRLYSTCLSGEAPRRLGGGG